VIAMTGLSDRHHPDRAIDITGICTQSGVPAKDNAPEATRYYVAKTGDGTTGLDWAKAFTKLQDALNTASSGDEIWVAGGVYYPDEGIGQIDNDVHSTFVMMDGVALYGGFDTADTQLSDRDWEANLTVLSGDIDKDDNDPDGDGVISDWIDINGDNAYHVVTADGVSGTAKLDGFTITAGDAHSGIPPDNRGGGLHCDGSGSGNTCSPSLTNMAFSGNRANFDGGAMYNLAEDGGMCHPILNNVSFSKNFALSSGGAIFNRAKDGGTCSPILTNVTISGGKAEVGGGIHCGGNDGTCSPVLTNVTLSGNTATASGGAMFNIGLNGGTSSPVLTNVVLSGNWAVFNGGAIYSHGYGGTSSPVLTNVTFSGNSADLDGGGMYNNASASGTSSPILTNVTFSGNSARNDGGAIYNKGILGNSRPKMQNSIMWNNKDSSGTGTITANIFNEGNKIKLTYSLVEDSGGSGSSWIGGSYIDGGGNIDENPMFVEPIDPFTAPITDGNLRLQTGSPAIDAGDNTFAAGVLTDLDGEPRIVDGDMDGTPTVDMGAYETQIYYYLPLIIN
jgi:predicted outer membrane repeat protein